MEKKDIKILICQVSLEDEIFKDKDAVWKSIYCKVSARQRIKIRTYWSMAASIAAVICVVIGFWSKVNITSRDTELSYMLPDGSTVVLAQNSSIYYNRIGWMFTRHVTLSGDASFEVTKQYKRRFSVAADKGTVTVLGTHFFISQQDNMLHVDCTEGSLEIATKTGIEVLEEGEQFDYDGSQMKVAPILPEYIEFCSSQLTDVITQIEGIYGLRVKNKKLCSGLLFSGFVPTNNMAEALEIIMRACNIDYDLNGNVLTINN